ncbi:MAG: outer membrane beta-barrel protein [Gemmatimonadota bacterium]|jgi:hypothetical protein
MRLVRRAALPLLAATALFIAPGTAQAQIFGFGVHVPIATDLGGGDNLKDSSFGIGGRIGAEIPLFPLSIWGVADYMFPDGDGTSYQNFGVDINLRLPIPLLQPYATGGYQARRFDDGEVSDIYNGFTLGGGVRFSFIVNAFLEARHEFYGDDEVRVGDDNQWLIRVGLTF